MLAELKFFMESKIYRTANSQETANLVTFTEKILEGKLHFLCSDYNDSFN